VYAVRISLISVAVKIALNFALIIPFKFLGLPLATAAASWLNLGLLLRHLRRRTGASESASEAAAYYRIALASLAMGALAWLVFHGTGTIFPDGTLCRHFRLGLAILTGFASLFPLFRIFRVAEAKEMYRIAGRLLRTIL